MYGEFIADFYRLVPVHFINNRRIHSPVAQMRADAERRHHAFNFRHQRLNGGVVEMVVVIVGDNQQIDLRHPLRVPRVITGESLIDERERRGVIAKYRVDQDTFTRQLQIPR